MKLISWCNVISKEKYCQVNLFQILHQKLIIQRKCVTSISLQKEVDGVNIYIVECKTPFTAFVQHILKISLLPEAFL